MPPRTICKIPHPKISNPKSSEICWTKDWHLTTHPPRPLESWHYNTLLSGIAGLASIACRAVGATLMITKKAGRIQVRTAWLVTAVLATDPISYVSRIWCRVTGFTKTVNKKFLTWTDDYVTYLAPLFVGRSLARGLLIDRSRGSWYCVISLLGGLFPVGSGGNNRNGSWLRLNVIPLFCIPFTRWSLLAWPLALGFWLGCCPCPCWWLLVNTWWEGVGILPVAMTSRKKNKLLAWTECFSKKCI